MSASVEYGEMSKSTELSPFNEGDFLAIEAAVLETDKGRWFLTEFGRRNRVADTQTLLNALDRLERNLTAQTVSQSDPSPDVVALANAIEATRSDIGSVRNDMLPDNAEIPADAKIFQHLSETSHQIAADLMATAEALQGIVSTLRKSRRTTGHADEIDGHVNTLFDGGWRQDVLAQRVSKAMGLLEHLDQNLQALASAASDAQKNRPNAKAQIAAQAIPTALTEENLKFFNADQELFEEKQPSDTSNKPPVAAIPNMQTPQAEVKIVTIKSSKSGESGPPDAPTEQREEAKPSITVEQVAAPAVPTISITPDPQPDQSPAAPAQSDAEDPASEPQVEPAPAATAEQSAAPVKPNIVVIRRSNQTEEPAAGNDTPEPVEASQPAQVKPAQVEPAPAEAPAIEQEPVTGAVEAIAPTEPETEVSVAPDNQHELPVMEAHHSQVTATPEPEASAEQPQEASAPVAEPQETTAPALDAFAQAVAETLPEPAPAEIPDNIEEAVQSETATDDGGVMSTFQDLAIETAAEPPAAEQQPQPAAQPAPEMATPPASEPETNATGEAAPEDSQKERIVVIRRSSSDDAEIPFADYLGIDGDSASAGKS